MKLTQSLMRSIRASGVPKPDADGHSATYVPTPEQITAGCIEIQKEWSESERQRRCLASKGDGDPWNLPVCREMSNDE